MILVDSSVWIDYFNGRRTPETDYLDDALSIEVIAVGDLVLAEVLQGFRDDAEFEAARQALASFEPVSIVTADTALASAVLYRRLRRQGISVRKTIDCLIAAYCIGTDCPLLHCDRDFAPFEAHLGLRVVHPERRSE
ncbi:MAG: type II toxin-antitoxin system VapC family toxin [Anaerolineae bacterium]